MQEAQEACLVVGREDPVEEEMATHSSILGFPGSSDGKEPACTARDLGNSPGGGHGNPLQYSCLENALDGAAWRAVVPKVSKESDDGACMHATIEL